MRIQFSCPELCIEKVKVGYVEVMIMAKLKAPKQAGPVHNAGKKNHNG